MMQKILAWVGNSKELSDTHRIYFDIFLKLSYLAIMGLFLTNFLIYPGAVKAKLFFTPIEFSAVVVALHAIIRARWNVNLSIEFVVAQLVYLAPIMLLISCGMFLVEILSESLTNYFLIDFGAHYVVLPMMAAAVAGFGLVHAGKEFFSQYGKYTYFLAIVWIIVGASILYLSRPFEFRTYTAEDGFIEYATGFGYLVAAVLIFRMHRFKKNFGAQKWQQLLFFAVCILGAIGFFLVAGEELSWGHRLFHLAAPEFILANNRQQEINIHNLDIVFDLVYPAYAVIGLYGLGAGIFSWFIKSFLASKKVLKNWLDFVSPDLFLSLNFFSMTVYVWLRDRNGYWKYIGLEELIELLLIIAVITHLLLRTYQLGTSKKK